MEGIECTEEGERYSWILDDYPKHCCSGLMEWEAGLDTRKVENGQCVETGLRAGAPWGKCLNCGNGICEDIENACNCYTDCKKAVTCTLYCEHGFKSDEQGGELCECNDLSE